MGRFIFSRFVADAVAQDASASKKYKSSAASLLERVHLALLAILLCFVALPEANAGFTQQGHKLVGTGAAGSAVQGRSVSLSSDGNTAIVGGYGDNEYMGAVWVFTRSAGVWTQEGSKLIGSGAVGYAAQGQSVSLSSDGNTAIVGGYGDDGYKGAVWVFTRSAGVWTQQGSKLVGTGAAGAAMQGISVSLSSDGNTAIVGGSDDNSSIGAAWVWRCSGGVWTQEGSKLVGTGAVGATMQGTSVSLSLDGNTAIVGGYGDNGSIGAVWVWSCSGGVWTQQGGKLVANDAVGSSKQGNSVSIASDGNTVIVGGNGDNGSIGAAWVWTCSGGVWTQQGGKLVANDAVSSSQQGKSVSIASDGNTAIVGGYADNAGVPGAAWVWTRSTGLWTQQGYKLFGSGFNGTPLQGSSVSLSSDGNTAIVGGYADNSLVGAAWIFINSGLLPVELTSFSVISQRLNAELQWKTTTEINNYGFEVERRTIQTSASGSQKEGAEWTRSGFVKGAGTSATPREYTFLDENLVASRYQFRLKQIDGNGSFHYSQSVEVEIGVALKVFELSQNYPNPFNPSTTLRYGLPMDSRVKLKVYNVLGQVVAELVNKEQAAGWQEVTWSANVSAGIYFYRLETVDVANPSNRFVQTKKMLLLN